MLDRAASPPHPPGEAEATFGLIAFPYSESICEVIPARTHVVVTASGPSARPAPLFEEAEEDGENWGDIGRGKSHQLRSKDSGRCCTKRVCHPEIQA